MNDGLDHLKTSKKANKFGKTVPDGKPLISLNAS